MGSQAAWEHINCDPLADTRCVTHLPPHTFFPVQPDEPGTLLDAVASPVQPTAMVLEALHTSRIKGAYGMRLWDTYGNATRYRVIGVGSLYHWAYSQHCVICVAIHCTPAIYHESCHGTSGMHLTGKSSHPPHTEQGETPVHSAMARKARHAIAQYFVLSLDQRQLHFHIMITKGDVALPPANSSTDNWLEHRFPFIPLDTACKFHPDAVITLYTLANGKHAGLPPVTISPRFVQAFEEKGCHIKHKEMDPDTFFHGTPLETWVRGNKPWLQKSEYWYSHMTDLFRSAVVWRYGKSHILT